MIEMAGLRCRKWGWFYKEMDLFKKIRGRFEVFFIFLSKKKHIFFAPPPFFQHLHAMHNDVE